MTDKGIAGDLGAVRRIIEEMNERDRQRFEIERKLVSARLGPAKEAAQDDCGCDGNPMTDWGTVAAVPFIGRAVVPYAEMNEAAHHGTTEVIQCRRCGRWAFQNARAEPREGQAVPHIYMETSRWLPPSVGPEIERAQMSVETPNFARWLDGYVAAVVALQQ